MPTAQVIQLDSYRQPVPVQQIPTRLDRVKELLAEATTAEPKSDIIENRLATMESQLATVLTILKNEGGK